MSQFTSTELVAMGRHIPTPFSITVDTEQGPLDLKIDSMLRVVPGKRLVALSKWQDRVVVVKLFINSNRWKRTMLRDINGINTLKQARIPTPNLLFQTNTVDNKAGVLVIEYLREGISLATLFHEAANEEDRAEALGMGVKAVAECHAAGLWQNDIHLDNFMLSSNVVHMLDGAEIKSKAGPLDANTRLENFARFLAQFPAEQDEEWPILVELYKLHAPKIDDVATAQFAERIHKARRRRLNDFERKLNRSTTANRCEQGSNFFYVYDRSIHSEALERFIADPDSLIDSDQLLKDGNSSTVAKVRIDERDYVLKRYNIKSFWHGVSRAGRPSRAHNSWRSASVLEMLGIATARPFLFYEERFLWIFRRRAYFLCEYVDENDLGTKWEDGQLEASGQDIVSLFRKLFRTLADYRISHGDMKATNFLLKDDELYVLDLDSMERSRTKAQFREKFSKDLLRFKKNWVGTSLEPEVDKLLEEAVKY